MNRPIGTVKRVLEQGVDEKGELYTIVEVAMEPPHVFVTNKARQIPELLSMGGKFYTMDGESWCDTPLDSWKLIPEMGGFIKQSVEPPTVS